MQAAQYLGVLTYKHIHGMPYVLQVAYRDETCRANEIKYWSECHVSEDFDMYTRLASVGSFGRYVTYTGTLMHWP